MVRSLAGVLSFYVEGHMFYGVTYRTASHLCAETLELSLTISELNYGCYVHSVVSV